MDPVQKLWLYEQWIGDHRDNTELAKNHALLIGSFSNPEMYQHMVNDNVHESSDEDYEETLKMVRETNIKLIEESKAPKKRRRKATLVNKQG
jgi:hypothetical protein